VRKTTSTNIVSRVGSEYRGRAASKDKKAASNLLQTISISEDTREPPPQIVDRDRGRFKTKQ
jgi:hypothetical protein